MKKNDGSFFSAILFDMDGTLIDSEPQWLIAETELMAEYGYTWTKPEQAEYLGGPLDRLGKYMYELAGHVQSPQFFTDSLISLMADKLRKGALLMDGAAELLQLCSDTNIPVALVTASPRVLVDAVLEHLPTHPFQISVSSGDVARTKPDPEGYLKAAELLGVEITNCLILEDSLTGVTAAKASGGYVIAIPHLVDLQESERVRVVRSVRELDRERLNSFYAQWNPI